MTLVPSPLIDRHEALGARMGEFAGWRMPIAYDGTVAEHTAVREAVGVFDVSHLGTVWVSGPGAAQVVDGSFTNDPRGLADGESQYTLCATPDGGGVLDDLIVYRLAEERWLAVPNAANTADVVARLRAVAADVEEPTEIRDESQGWAILAVQGPDALPLVDGLVDAGVGALSFGQHTETTVDDAPALVCRTGYTGERGVEIVVASTGGADGGTSAAARVWDAVTAAGAVPCGLAARDTLRLEMGYPLHGNELSPTVSPYAARLGWAVKPDDRAFVGRDGLVRSKADGVGTRLWGLVGTGRRPPRSGMAVDREGVQVGHVTSGSFSPTLGVGIGLALLDEAVTAGDGVTVDVRGTDVPFEVARPPMVGRDPR